MGNERILTIKPGDTTRMRESFGSGANRLMAGESVRVTAFDPIALGRTDNHGRPPGLYHNPRSVAVEAAGGRRASLGTHLLEERPADAHERIDGDALRFADLPETPLVETDFVRGPQGDTLWVDRIDYLAVLSGGPEARAYTCMGRGGSRSDHALFELEYLAPGPIRRRAQGSLTFGSVDDEAAFLGLVGECDEVRHPDSGLYGFTRDEAEEALRTGLAQGFHPSSAPGLTFPERAGKFHLVTYRDPEAGERIRLEFLERNGLSPAGPAP